MLMFCLGLAIGLAVMVWQQRRLRFQMAQMLDSIGMEMPMLPLSLVPLALVSRLVATITKQQSLCQQLEQQIEVWKQLLQSAPIAYLQVDDENRLVWCNGVAFQLLAIQQWDLVKPRLLLQLVRSYELDQLVDEARASQKSVCTDWLFHPPLSAFSTFSESVRRESISIRGYGLPLGDGQVGVFLENRQEAEVLKQQRDRWASDVAHELKTPLTSIRLVAETLQSRLDPPLRAWVDRLLNEVIRLSNLVQDLLDLSQLHTNPAARLNLKSLNLVELVQSAWLNLEPLARKKHLQIDYTGENPAMIDGDEPRLYRVLVNLLDNSIKYSPPRQHIQVQVSFVTVNDPHHSFPGISPDPGNTPNNGIAPIPDDATDEDPSLLGQQVCLEVIDAGPGFHENDLPYVFDRFYQADLSRSRLGDSHDLELPASTSTAGSKSDSYPASSGLGLAIVRQIVEAHQGRVMASNHPETGGAWLRVFLPCHSARTELRQ